jgi:small conductance mechanosensitive channel
LIAGLGALAWALHWLIGAVQRRARRWFVSAEAQPGEPPALRHLLIDWCGNGLRTLVWALYVLCVLYLPPMRVRVESLTGPLRRLRVGDWLLNIAIDVVVMVFLMRFAAALIRTAFELFEKRALSRGETSAKRRSQTLSAIFSGVAQSAIFFVGLMMLLQHLDINVTPILASAGVVGLAIGFGAQSLIKDFFAGFMILLEDQYNVGDTIKVGETSGTVERLTLRVTLIRALDGSLTTIPNGTINTVSNFSKDWSRAVLDVEVDYNEDADRAMKTMLAAAQQLRAERPEEILEEPAMLGVERLSNSSIGLRLTVKTAANKQNEIARELRRRVKLAFDQAGIKAPSREQFVLAGESKRAGERESGRAGNNRQ